MRQRHSSSSANGLASPSQQQQQANGHVPQLPANGVQPRIQQQQQDPGQGPVQHSHGIHQLPLDNRRRVDR